MIHYLGNKTEFCDYTLGKFIINKFPEIVDSVYLKKQKQVSEQKMKQIINIFKETYEMVYWTRDYTYPDNSTFLEDDEQPEIIYETCELDEEDIVSKISDIFSVEHKLALEFFNDTDTYYVNYYYGDSETYCYAVKKKE